MAKYANKYTEYELIGRGSYGIVLQVTKVPHILSGLQMISICM